MDADKPRCRWYRKKRWWAALLWLPVAYAIGYGPLVYAFGRGWVSPSVAAPLAVPTLLSARLPGCARAVDAYGRWWLVKAFRDAGCMVEVLPDSTVLTTRMPNDAERDGLGR